jgi:hypothetical protein
MNPITLKLWIDAKKAQYQKMKDASILYSDQYMDAKIQVLDELVDDFNLEDIVENVDYYIHKNF